MGRNKLPTMGVLLCEGPCDVSEGYAGLGLCGLHCLCFAQLHAPYTTTTHDILSELLQHQLKRSCRAQSEVVDAIPVNLYVTSLTSFP